MASQTRRTAPDRLTPAQSKFCDHYALHGNGAEAYAHAYPASRKQSPKYRGNKAVQLLKKVGIKGGIAARSERASEMALHEFEISAHRVLQGLAAIAFADPGDFYQWGSRRVPIYNKDGSPRHDSKGRQVFEDVPYLTIKPSNGLTREQRAAIVGADLTVSQTGKQMLSIKMADKRAALRDLGQHLKLFTQGIDIGGKGGGPVQLVISSAEDAL